jgi:hypothetical protein
MRARLFPMSQYPDPEPLRQRVYRSTAVRPLGHTALRDLLEQARERNKRENLTGLLVYHEGCFVQWLEGPASGVERVWQSIQADTRHTEVEALPTPWSPHRLFPEWRLRLASGELPAAEADAVPVEPLALHTLNRHADIAPDFMQGIAFWRTLPAPEAMALTLCRGDDADVRRLRDRVLEQRPLLSALGWHLVGPVSRAMGEMWMDDRLQGIELVLGQGRMQLLVRNVAGQRPRRVPRPGGLALVVPAPGEQHLAGATFAAVALDAAGWQVNFAFPRDDDELIAALKQKEYGVLHLAQSAVFARDDRLAELATTIHRVRQSLLRPMMQILVSGRAFAEQPGLSVVVGADGDGVAQGTDAADLQAMLRWAGARGWLPEAAAAQAALDSVAARLLRGHFADSSDPHPGG